MNINRSAGHGNAGRVYVHHMQAEIFQPQARHASIQRLDRVDGRTQIL
jgi:hypothetical protein